MAFQASDEAPEVIHHALIVDRNGNMSNAEFASRSVQEGDENINENVMEPEPSSPKLLKEVRPVYENTGKVQQGAVRSWDCQSLALMLTICAVRFDSPVTT